MSDRSSLLTDPLGTSPGVRPTGTDLAPLPKVTSLLSDLKTPERLSEAVKRTQTLTPDTAARIYKAQRTTGFPTEVIKRNLDQIEQETAGADFDVEYYRQHSPLLADWLASDPNHLALAQDDLGPLSAVEQTLTVGRNLAGALAAGVAGIGTGFWGAVQGLAEIPVGAMPGFTEGVPVTAETIPGFGPDWMRADGTRKGEGFLGVRQRPDGGVSSEMSVGVNIDGKDVEIPTMVPTLSTDEVQTLLALDPAKDAIPQPILDKAIAHAHARIAAGQSPFAGTADVRLSPRLAAYAQAVAATATQLQDRLRGSQTGAGTVARGIYSGAESVGQMAPLLAVGLIAGPAAMLGVVGLQTGGQTYAQGRSEGLSPAHAALYGSIQGTVEVATEYIPAHRLLKDLGAHSGLALTLAHQLIPEVVGEEVATALQDLNDWANLPSNQDKTLGDYARARPDAAVQTLIATLVATGVTVGGAAGMASLAHGPATEKLITDLGTAATEAKTAQRSPEKFAEFVAQATAGGVETLYAPVESWVSYWQSKGEDPAQIAEVLTGNPTALLQAETLQTDLAIPTAQYAATIAATEHNAFFAKELRLAPDQMNAREDAAFREDQAAQAETVAPDQAAADADAIKAELVTRFVEGGQMDPGSAETAATVLGGIFPNVADRAGIDVATLAREWLPVIRSVATAQRLPDASARAGLALEQRPTAPGPVGPANDKGEAARFAFHWDPQEPGVEPFPQYDIVGGELDGSTVSAETLQARGIPIPETPAVSTFNQIQWGAFTDETQPAAPEDQARIEAMTPEALNALADQMGLWRPGAGYRAIKAAVLARFGKGAAPAERRTSFDQQPGPVFYSRLTRAVEVSTQTKASGAQWKATIKNAKIGINRDEFALTQVEDLEDGTTYTKQEVLDYLAANAIAVQDVTLGRQGERIPIQAGPWIAREPTTAGTQRFKMDLGDHGYAAVQEVAPGGPWFAQVPSTVGAFGERMSPHFATQTEAEQWVREKVARGAEPTPTAATQFDAYQLPGGDEGSYREVFLTAPRNQDAVVAEDDVIAQAKMDAEGQGDPWDTLGPNGRERYISAARARFEAVGPTWRDGHGAYQAIENPIVRLRFNTRTTADGQRVLFLEEVQPPSPANQERMPPLFQKNWRDIAFKYALRIASEQGLDAVAWTTGEQQAARYDLSKHLDRIEYEPITDDAGDFVGTYEVAAYDTAGTEVFREEDVPLSRIEELAGKEIAKKIEAGEGEKRPDSPYRDWRSLSGLDLKVGGEGLKQLYDVDFARVVNGLPAVKKHGGKVGTVGLRNEDVAPYDLAEVSGGRWRLVDRRTNLFLDNAPVFTSGADAEKWIADHAAPTTQPALTITPELRDAVMAGQPLFQQPPEGGPNARITFTPGAAPLIELFTSRNLSSLLHEFGHLSLTMLASVADQVSAIDVAARTPEQQQILADLATLDAWLTDEDHTGPGYSVKQQEQMARGFEAYLLEGTAPSSDLRRAFRRIKSWMLSIYKDLQGLRAAAGTHIQLNADVRAVFDRLLASDQASAAAEAEGQIRPMFLTQPEGMSDNEWRAYQTTIQDAHERTVEALEQRLLREQQQEARTTYRAERARVQGEVMAEVSQRPAYTAVAAIRDGLTPDGTPLPTAPLKLASAAVQGSPAFLRDFTAVDGLHPDVAAELLGFPSGQALVDALKTAPSLARVVASEVSVRMAALHPTTLTDGTLHVRAQAAVGLHHAEVVRAELAALSKLRRSAAPLVAAEREAGKDQVAAKQEEIDALASTVRAFRSRARSGPATMREALPSKVSVAEYAAERVSAMKLRELRPHLYRASARRMSRLATDAAARQDFDGAIAAKQTELIHLAIAAEIVTVLDDIDDFKTTAKKFFRPDAQLATRRAMDLVYAARLVADTFLHPEKRSDAVEALDLVAKYDPDLSDALEGRIRDAMAGGTSFKDLTVDGFTAMRDTALALWTQSLRSQQVLIDGKKLDRAVVATALTDRLAALGTPTAQAGYTRASTAWDQATMYLLGMRAALRRTESWVDAMDGGNPQGVFRRYVWTPISEAAAQYRIAKQAAVQSYLDLIQPIAATLTRQQIAAPELVGPHGAYTFSGMSEVLGALQHAGNQSNLEKFLVGRGWGSYREDGTLDTSRFDAFRARLEREGLLTKAHYDFLQGLWDLFETQKPDAQRVHHELYGYYFNEITAHPLQTSFGTYQGGYVPAMPDPLLVPDANIKAEKTAILEGGNSFIFPTTGWGSRKSRVHYNKPLIMDVGLVPMQIDKALKFIHLEPRVKDVARLVFDRRIRAALDTFDPAVAGDMLVPWLQRSATQRVTSSGSGWATRGLNAFARGLRTRVGLNIMSVNVVNALQQLTGVSIAALKVKPRYLSAALVRYLRNPSAMAEANTEASDFMKTLVNGQGVELQQQIENILINPNVFQQVRDFATQHGYVLSVGAQNIINHLTWAGAYDQATDHGATHRDAVREADAAVRQTQGTFAAEDVSRFETGSPAVRAFTMFASYFNMQANLLGTEFVKVVRDLGLRKGAGRGLYVYTLGFMLPAVMAEVIRQAVGGPDADPEDDDWWMQEFLSVFFGSQARGAAAFLPGVGPAITTAIAGFDDQPWNDRLSTSPAISAIENSVHAPAEVYKAIVAGRLPKRAVQDTLTLIGLLTGLPVAPLGKPLGYLAEEDKPDDAVALARGLVTGRSQR